MATQVSFYTGVPDVVAYAQRLARKVVQAAQPLLVVGPSAVLQAVDVQLWTFADVSFVSHAWDDAPASQQRRSAVVLSRHSDWTSAVAATPRPVVLNLGLPLGQVPSSVQRALELVGLEAEAVAAGRAQWKRYLALGLTPQHMLGSQAP